MFGGLYEPRSDPGYDDEQTPSSGTGCGWQEILWSPVILFLMLLMAVLPPLLLAGYGIKETYLYTKRSLQNGEIPWLTIVGVACLVLGMVWILAPEKLSLRVFLAQATQIPGTVTSMPPTFTPQPTIQPTPKPTYQIPEQDARAMQQIAEQEGYSCQDQPLYGWRLPGKYTYWITDSKGNESFFTVEYPLLFVNLSEPNCQAQPWSFAGEALGEPPIEGVFSNMSLPCNYSAGAPYGANLIQVGGVEQIKLPWGDDFDAVRVDTEQSYRVATINDPHGTRSTTEWYICGLGLVRAETFNEDWYQYHSKQMTARLELVSVVLQP